MDQVRGRRHQAQYSNLTICATDWKGMAEDDLDNLLANVVSDLANFDMVANRQHQGVLNFLFLAKLLKGNFHDDAAMQVNAMPAYNNDYVYYYGISQGGIMGSTFMALTQDVERGVLGVPGMGYAMMLQRSVDFTPYSVLLEYNYPDWNDPYNPRYPDSPRPDPDDPDPAEQILLISIMQNLWDRIEPAGYGTRISGENRLPNTPEHKVLIHMSKEDSQVHHLATHFLARAVNAKQMSPYIMKAWGLEEAAYPYDGNAFVDFDFHKREAPDENIPDPKGDNDAHGGPSGSPGGMEQIDKFLWPDGEVVDGCGGACDYPE
jgi:hypothetical protein